MPRVGGDRRTASLSLTPVPFANRQANRQPTGTEQLLRPVLAETDSFAAVRIDRMVEDRVGEHRAMRAQLDATETRALRETLEMLRAHLEGEGRDLLSARVLRDDLVTIEITG